MYVVVSEFVIKDHKVATLESCKGWPATTLGFISHKRDPN
jgi:hypothetical protein